MSSTLPPITFSGLASGLDTDTIISRLMEIERRPVTMLQTRQSQLQQESSAWKDIGTRMNSLLSTLSPLEKWDSFVVKDAASTNADILTATADSTAATGTYQISVKKLAQAHKIYSNGTTTSVNIGAGAKISFTVSVDTTPDDGVSNPVSKTVSVAADASGNVTLEAIRDAINKDAGSIVSATLVQSDAGKYLVVTSLTQGAAGAISLVDDAANPVLHSIGLINADDTLHTLVAAQNAEFTVEGLPFSTSSNTVKGAIDGVTLNIQSVGETSLTISESPDKTIDKLQKFLDQYNSLMDFISTKLGKTATGTPGDLYGDPTLIRIQTSLRDVVLDLASLGVGTGTGSSYDITGKVSIQDRSKLTEALKNDPQGTWQIINDVASRVQSLLGDSTKGFIGTTVSKQNMISDSIKDLDDEIQRWNDRLQMKETQLRTQFTQLEEALSTMQSQGTWLAGQIASLGLNR